MISAIVSDFSRVLLFPKDPTYSGGLNALHKEILKREGYDFFSYFILNQELLDFYKTVWAEKGIDPYIFTTESVQNDPAVAGSIKGSCKEVFSALHLGLKKTDPNAYGVIAQKIGAETKEILYIDDKQENLDSALESGMNVLLYVSNEQVMRDITDFIR